MTTNNPTREEVKNALLTIGSTGFKVLEKVSSGINKGVERYFTRHKIRETIPQYGGDDANKQPNDKNLTAYTLIIKNIIDFISIFIKKYIEFISNRLVKTVDSLSGNILEKPMVELAPELNIKIVTLAKQLDSMTKQKDYLDNIDYLAEVVTEIVLDFLHAIDPKVNEILDDVIKSNREIGEKSAAGAVSIGIGMFKSAVSAIPFFGFFINGFLLLGTILNELMGITKKSTETGIETYKKVDKMLDETKLTLNENKQKLDQAVRRFQSGGSRMDIELKVSSFLNKNKIIIEKYLSNFKNSEGKLNVHDFFKSIPSILEKLVSYYQSSNYLTKPFIGGAKERRYKVKYNINKTSKRLLKSINRFTGKSKNKTFKK
jgi:hypothetical protein